MNAAPEFWSQNTGVVVHQQAALLKMELRPADGWPH